MNFVWLWSNKKDFKNLLTKKLYSKNFFFEVALAR